VGAEPARSLEGATLLGLVSRELIRSLAEPSCLEMLSNEHGLAADEVTQGLLPLKPRK
jgi:hypothetical protein